MAFVYDTSDAITVAGIFPVWDEGIREHFDRQQGYVIRTVRCKWADRAALVLALRGGQQLIGNVILNFPAQQYPPYPWMYIDAVDVEGVEAQGLDEDANGFVAYAYARLQVRYTSLGFEAINTGALTLDFGVDIIRMPDASVKFSDGAGERLVQPPNKRVPSQVITILRSNLAQLPIAAILNASANPLNNASIFGAPANSILFDGGRAGIRFTTAGSTNYDLELRFAHRDKPKWNEDFDSTGAIRPIVKSDGNPVYDPSDLNALLI